MRRFPFFAVLLVALSCQSVDISSSSGGGKNTVTPPPPPPPQPPPPTPSVTGVSITPHTADLVAGDSLQAHVNVTASNGASTSFRCRASSPTTASVGATSCLTKANNPGLALIIASATADTAKADTLKLTVWARLILAVKIAGDTAFKTDTASVVAGQERDLYVRVMASHGWSTDFICESLNSAFVNVISVDLAKRTCKVKGVKASGTSFTIVVAKPVAVEPLLKEQPQSGMKIYVR